MSPRSAKAPDDRAIFLQQFLRNPRQIGSVIPSSRYLERRVVALADIAHAKTVVELGTGTGGITRAVLATMSADTRLLGIEINPRLHQLLTGFDDPRLIAHFGSAEQLSEILRRHQLPAPDAIISGIPFSTMDRELGSRILAAIADTLAPGGRFVAYQVSAQVARLARPVLGIPRRQIELRNIPPMRVYRWDQPAEVPAVRRAVGA